MTITLRLLTTMDVENLYPRLRLADAEETICLGSNPRQALLMGAFDNMFLCSKGRAYALVDSNEVIAAIGFSSSGSLWALSTEFTRSQRRELFARTSEILDRLLKEAGQRGAFFDDSRFLHNLIHARNKVAIKWLQHSGRFQVNLDEPIEYNGEVFYHFRSLMDFEMLPLAATTQQAIHV